MRGVWIATLCAALFGAPAVAQQQCAALSAWAAQAGPDQTGAVQLPQIDGWQTPQCRRSLAMNGARSVHCAWAFAYRAEAARQAFVELSRASTLCFGDQISVTDKQQVNHPDSYDLHQFSVPTGRIIISLKDKGGLQETYVFLRAVGGVP